MRARRGRAAFAALAAAAALKFGGGLLLDRLGMGWRAWVNGVLCLAIGVLFGMCMSRATHWLADCRRLPGGIQFAAVLICGLGSGILLVLYFYYLLVFGSFTDRVSQWEGQKSVVQSTGIFQETVYRYVNCFVHGEVLYVWKD